MKKFLIAATSLAAATAHAHISLEQRQLAAGSHTFKIIQSCQAGSANWESTLETH